MCDFKMCDVRRCGAHPQTYLTSELDKNVFKTSEISVILISLKNEEKKIEREKRKKKKEKVKKARYKKSGEISEEHFIHRKVCEKKKIRKKYGKECAN